MSQLPQTPVDLTSPVTPGIHEAPELVDKSAKVEVTEGLRGSLASADPETVFFSLGAVYEGVGVPFDIWEQFCLDHNLDIKIKTYIIDKPIFHGLKEWAYYLQATTKPVFEVFYQWLLRQGFNAHNEFWQLRMRKQPILDPYNLEVTWVDVQVFLPYGRTCYVDMTPGNVVECPSLYLVHGAINDR